MSASKTLTVRNAAELVRYIYDSVVIGHDVFVSTNEPAITEVIVASLSAYCQFDRTIQYNEKFSMAAVVSFMTGAMAKKGGRDCFVAIIPKKIQVGINLPSKTTRIIVDDAGVFLGDIMVQVEHMKEGCKK